MLNKKDPLIGAVQQVMQKSNAEREAVKVVNEKFGIQDRKALPHEKQGAWDSAYQQVLSEASDPSKYSEKQKRFAATAGNPRKIDSADLAHVRKHGGKHIEEEQLDEKKMSDSQMKKREEIVKSMKKGMSGFKKRYGERAEDVMYASATKQAMSESIKNVIAEKLSEQSILPKNLGPGSGFAGQHSVGNKTVRSKTPQEFMKQTSTYSGMSAATEKPKISDAASKLGRVAQKPVNAAPRPGERVPGEKVGTNAQLTAQARARQGFGAPAGGNYQSAQAKAPKPNVTGIEGNPMGDVNPGQEYSTPTAPKSQYQQNTSPTTKPSAAKPALKPATVMSKSPSFEFSAKQREAAKAGKASAADVQAWAKSRGMNPNDKGLLRNYLNAAQNKTMKTGPGAVKATATQTAAQSAEMKMKAGQAQRGRPAGVRE